ncbi:MAG: hypothetical protein IJS75_00095 [Bacteroidales bacterium]|nr:hypothetical protein [Bacteroidales bacterium]
MDIDLLSKMVKELILDRDEVTLPGVGTFVAETVPASFSDRGYTINPPYRRLSFRQRQNAEDNCLIELYARSNGIDQQQASRFLLDFLMEMKEVLKQKKSIVFPGLGRLRSTKENNFFFVADEDLDIYPEGFGLEPISLKTHQETPEEVTDAIQKLKAVVMAPADEPEAILEPAPEAQPIAPEAQPIVPAESVSPAEEEGAVVGSVSFPTTVPSDAEDPAAPVESEPASEAQPIVPAESVSPAEEEGTVVGSVSFPTTAPSDERETEAPVEPEAAPPEPVLEEVVPIELVEPEEAPATPSAEGVSPAKEEGVVAGSVSFPTTAPSDVREPKVRKKLPTWAKALIWIVASVLAFLLLFAIGARLFPDFFDSILYSHEELDIIRF